MEKNRNKIVVLFELNLFNLIKLIYANSVINKYICIYGKREKIRMSMDDPYGCKEKCRETHVDFL